MNKGAYILITTPDLRVHIKKYLENNYKDWKGLS
jgi:hypothetical protein